MRGFSGSRLSDVLYQGTTLVGPLDITKNWALAPGLLLGGAPEQGLKPNFLQPFTARLKSCPDTKLIWFQPNQLVGDHQLAGYDGPGAGQHPQGACRAYHAQAQHKGRQLDLVGGR